VPPLSNRGHKDEEKGFVIVKVAYSFLYIFSTAIFYLLWDAYTKNIFWQIELYIGIYLAYLVLFVLILKDIYNTYAFFKATKNKEGTSLLENIHFLCADPMCPRCGGWYFGMALSLSITLSFTNSIISLMRNYSYSQYFAIIAGIILFLLSTPVHGSLIYLKGIRSKFLKSKKLKLVLGLVSGLSLALITIGILMIIT